MSDYYAIKLTAPPYPNVTGRYLQSSVNPSLPMKLELSGAESVANSLRYNGCACDVVPYADTGVVSRRPVPVDEDLEAYAFHRYGLTPAPREGGDK